MDLGEDNDNDGRRRWRLQRPFSSAVMVRRSFASDDDEDVVHVGKVMEENENEGGERQRTTAAKGMCWVARRDVTPSPTKCRSSESHFGAMEASEDEFEGSGDPSSGSALIGDEELADRPAAKSNAEHGSAEVDSAPGFDVCKEYGYKYEYDDDGDVDGDVDEEDDDEHQSYSDLHGAPNGGAPSNGKSGISLFHHKNAASASGNAMNYILGLRYHPLHDYAPRREDETALFWFTYRCEFPEIAPYGITTDAGWGCMLRSTQMMLAQALRMHYRDRSWRPPRSLRARRSDPFLVSLMTWFADFPSSNGSCYSIHNMVAAGVSRYETLPGEWYGPQTACHVVRELCEIRYQQERNRPTLQHNSRRLHPFRVHVAQEACVYCDVVQNLMTANAKPQTNVQNATANTSNPLTAQSSNNHSSSHQDPLMHLLQKQENTNASNSTPQNLLDWDTSLLLLVPLRLGLKSFNAKSYALSLAHLLSLHHSLGFMGGSPRKAVWFYGATSDGSKVFGLDPHTIQNAPRRRRRANPNHSGKANAKSPSENQYSIVLSDEYLRSVHCNTPVSIDMARIDPSLALAFYCRDRSDFDALRASVDALTKECSKQSILVPFSFMAAEPNYEADVSAAMAEMMGGSSSHLNAGFEDGDDSHDDDDIVSDEDEYVML